LRRGGVSYTIDTIGDIEERYAHKGKLSLILGDDLLPGFSSWKSADELASRVDLVIASRVPIANDLSESFRYPHRFLGNPRFELSSSHIRKLIAENGAWRFLVPDGVRDIIEKRSLYSWGATPPSEYTDLCRRVDRWVFSQLSEARYLHSRGVALMAADLCERNGQDPDKGYLAGIAHDVCKELPFEAMRSLALENDGPLSPMEKELPSLLHARASARALEKNFGVRDLDVLESIRMHTLGSESMGTLAKLVYAADKIEPSRRGVSPALRVLALSARADELFLAVLSDNVDHLHSRGKRVFEETLALLSRLQSESNG
jgi:nicotinate-nucleotide adenylyltransferase